MALAAACPVHAVTLVCGYQSSFTKFFVVVVMGHLVVSFYLITGYPELGGARVKKGSNLLGWVANEDGSGIDHVLPSLKL